MPVNKAAYFRFEIIDECLRNTKKKWTKAELLRYVNRRLSLSNGEDMTISASQIRYDLEHMQSEYGAPIEMYREGKVFLYRYEDPDFSIRNIPVEQEDMVKLNDAVLMLQQMRGFSIADEMLEVLQKLEHKYQVHADKETKVISFEQDTKTPGLTYLEDIYHAILGKIVLKLAYQTFNAATSRIWHIHPYLLKEYDHRWYLVGLCEEKKSIGIFALDRIIDIKVSNLSFTGNDGDTEEHFKDIIGITLLPQRSVETIELVFSARLAPYIRTKPLHRSQKIIQFFEDGAISLQINVCINPELIRLLLGYGKDVKVIKPDHLAQEIQRIIIALIEQYSHTV